MPNSKRCPRSIVIIAAIAVVVTLANWLPHAKAEPVGPTTIEIITPNNRARLCPNPGCGQHEHLDRIPTGTKLLVESSSSLGMSKVYVIWYKVMYGGKQGWVSEFDTDAAPANPWNR